MKKYSYTSGISDEPLLGLTIGEAFEDTVNRFPKNEAVVSRHQNIRYTYEQLEIRVNQCAKAFLAIDIQKGYRVGICASNCVEWLIVQIATAKIGAILVNINPSYRTYELEYALNHSGCKSIVIADKNKHTDYSEMLFELIPNLKNNTLPTFDCNEFPLLRSVISLSQTNLEGILMWEEFIDMGIHIDYHKLETRQRLLSFDDPINIQFTSGTTGSPKGATLSHHNILNNAYFTSKTQRITEKDKIVIPVPLYHCFGMVLGNLGCISQGATMIYPSETFDAEATLKAISEEKATALFGVPTMFFAELDHPDLKQYDLSSLRTGIMAGSLCPSELMRKVQTEMHLVEMEIGYGMTETSPLSTQTRHDAPFDKRVSTVGRVLPHTEIKIIHPETHQVVPIGESGELCTRGYCVMLGYWNDPIRTKESIDTAGWMHSGDLATMDEEGYINIVGRIKDMIIRGGENIYPKVIEEFLYTHDKIKEVSVFGIPDEKYGEQVCVWIQMHDKSELTASEIKEYCRGKIAHYTIPGQVKFVTEFPMTVTGKIRKVEMREAMMAELGLTK
ncbi:AMP-binding protein [Flavobacterium frigoris]|uniref:Fatty-acyl-CoA synthase n=1 Tax=Flavobacterium frigoris TaxID=229204 RepID=A0A1H9FEV3_FLAFI|nr:AMP-binding protein [Flavobacterium frigoris]SEQ35993.1 fatty-acyl-CoA synthase [Flavobacterium frigoris]